MREMPVELRKLIARRAKGGGDVLDSEAESGSGPKGEAEGESSTANASASTPVRPDDAPIENGPSSSLKGKKRVALVPPATDSRVPKRRGRPSLLDMRMKGLEPTIFETMTRSAELSPRATDGSSLGPGAGSGLGLGDVSSLLPDDVVYPDPPPNIPMWDPAPNVTSANVHFHTQVPYQIQMARQEMADRLARSFVASVPGVSMDDYLPETDHHNHEQDPNRAGPSHAVMGAGAEQGQDAVPDFSLEDLQRHGLFGHEISQPQVDRTDLDRDNALALDKMQNLAVRALTCENCGRTGTSVWRKLTIGEDAQKQTYRVCNRESRVKASISRSTKLTRGDPLRQHVDCTTRKTWSCGPKRCGEMSMWRHENDGQPSRRVRVPTRFCSNRTRSSSCNQTRMKCTNKNTIPWNSVPCRWKWT
jgi:hypothetical protein